MIRDCMLINLEFRDLGGLAPGDFLAATPGRFRLSNSVDHRGSGPEKTKSIRRAMMSSNTMSPRRDVLRVEFRIHASRLV